MLHDDAHDSLGGSAYSKITITDCCDRLHREVDGQDVQVANRLVFIAALEYPVRRVSVRVEAHIRHKYPEAAEEVTGKHEQDNEEHEALVCLTLLHDRAHLAFELLLFLDDTEQPYQPEHLDESVDLADLGEAYELIQIGRRRCLRS